MRKFLISFWDLGAFRALNFIFTICFFTSFQIAVWAYVPGKEYHLTILHTSDTHGHYWRNSKGEYGFSALKTLIDRIRTEVHSKGGEVILVSSGDINTGYPRSDLLAARPDIAAMNMIGYDAMAIGNHEFDRPNGVLFQQIKAAQFPFLSANIYNRNNNTHAFQDHLYKTILSDLKVGMVGLLTEDTPTISNPENTKNFYFRPVVEEAKELIPQIRQSADLVVAITHQDYKPEEDGKKLVGDLLLAREVPGIDVIAGGHEHNTLEQPAIDKKHGTLIMHVGAYGEKLGRLDLIFKDGKVKKASYKVIPVKGTADEPLPEDPELLALLKSYYEQGSGELNQVVGKITDGPFIGRGNNLLKESNLGRLITTAQREALSADVAVIGSGGIRGNLEVGTVTYENILTVQPFYNSICTVEMNSDTLKDYLEKIMQKSIVSFSGVKIFKDPHDKIVDIKISSETYDNNEHKNHNHSKDRASLKSKQSYKLALNCFSAKGGDSWPVLTSYSTFKDTGIIDSTVLADYFKKHTPVSANDFAEDSVQIMENVMVIESP